MQIWRARSKSARELAENGYMSLYPLFYPFWWVRPKKKQEYIRKTGIRSGKTVDFWDEIRTYNESKDCFDRVYHVSCYRRKSIGLENKGSEFDNDTGVVN